MTSDILVVDQKDQIVSGLTANDFIITEDGERQQVDHFHLGDNVSIPRTIVFIIGYYPTNKEHDGKLRRIKFAVRRRPDYQILGRNFHYAPGVR